MQQNNIEIIVLNITKYQDRYLIVHGLTKDYGRASFITSISKSLNHNLFLPLNIIQAEMLLSNKGKMNKIRNISLINPLFGIRNNIYKNSITIYMSEVLYKVLKEGAIESGLYDWAVKQIAILNDLEADFSNFHLWWSIDFAVNLGYSPTWQDLEPFTLEYQDKMKELLSCPFKEAMLVKMNGEIRNYLCDSVLSYIQHHIDTNVNIKSLSVLRDLWSY